MRHLAPIWVVALCGCELPPASRIVDAGPDAGGDAVCLGCHDDVAAAWSNPSSHGILLPCSVCHESAGNDAGAGHATTSECAACHSERAHQDHECTSCHAVHGSTNAFLIVPRIALPGGGEAEVLVTRPEGASTEGLARAGVPGLDAGTGLCEVCHTETRYYDRDGEAEPHETIWCAACHDHQIGFLPVGR